MERFGPGHQVQAAGTVAFGITHLPLFLASERTTLHDRVAGTKLVYDWGGRGADLHSPLARFLGEHGAAPGG